MIKKEAEYFVEEFHEGDCIDLEKLFEEVWPSATEYPEHWRRKRMLTSEQIRKEMRSGIRFFGVRQRGKIVGTYKARISDRDCFGEHQSILPSFRGSGIGSLMYDQFIELARNEGCKINSVNVLVEQIPTLKLVKKHGFHSIGKPFEQSPGMLVQRFERKVG